MKNVCQSYLATFITASTGDEILQESDLGVVVGELLEAKNKAYDFGLALKVPPHELDSIRITNRDPQDQLTDVLKYFLKQVEPRPTWRLIIDALKSTVVNLPRLAEKIKAAHFPNPTATRNNIPPETSNGIL